VCINKRELKRENAPLSAALKCFVSAPIATMSGTLSLSLSLSLSPPPSSSSTSTAAAMDFVTSTSANRVTVTFLESPHLFFILRHSNDAVLDKIDARLRDFDLHIGASPAVENPELGNLYVTRSPHDDKVKFSFELTILQLSAVTLTSSSLAPVQWLQDYAQVRFAFISDHFELHYLVAQTDV
jgi:hypothetical protein